MDKVGQRLWACLVARENLPIKSLKCDTADFIVCNFVWYQLALQIHNSRMQITKWYLHYFFQQLMN